MEDPLDNDEIEEQGDKIIYTAKKRQEQLQQQWQELLSQQ